ncbi:Ig-like domain-containing protein [Flavobacterium caseinilyticum]|uniref:DUF3494 domain-containing protein n=1 Tax=Flavobacterium caseinilyticum TaxID=2541732 RepID=A0A4R5ARZ8_9FLAO|nr:Ig-like domain-containing protein [Flavobacterium caseinilyticum]TDD75483.1 DUF3494 domain-containing protein [Flavobacterium caseinilyticum]
MKVKNLLLTFAILFIALISGCASDDFVEVEGVCPIVISTIPANGALGVPFRQVISATFNEEMNPSTINATTFIVTEATGTTIAGTISYSGNTATFTPSAPLTPNTTYTARIKTGVKDVMGNALQTDYVWTFTTGMLIVPMVITTDPAADAVNVALNKTITATFSVPMDPLTLNNSTFIVKQGTTEVAGVITYTGSTVTFTPASPFTPNTLYVVTITNAAKSTEGASLASNFVWSFTTEAAPTITSTDPTDKATGVPLNKVISATFSVPMDLSTLDGSTFTVKHGTYTVPGVITYAGTTVSFTPTLLVADTDYTVTITTGAKSASGIPLASNYVWTFTTGATAVAAPTVTATDPISNATGVALNKVISATFSVPMDPSTLNSATFYVKHGTYVVPGVISYSGSTVYFTPSLLVADTDYTVTITTGAKSLSGMALASNYVWDFKTGATAAVVPTVTSTDPTDKATGVALNKVISATFSVPMDLSTLNGSTFTVKHGTYTVPGVITYTGTTVSFTPTLLVADTDYTVTITTGAKSAAGIPLASNYVWTFRTLAPSSAAPIVIATDPNNNETGVPLNKVISATFNVPMDLSTLNGSTFTVKHGTYTVPGIITYAGTTLYFTPTLLVADTNYTATITTGAKSAAGVALASNYVWNFTTVKAIIVTPPPVIAGLDFGVFGGNAGITNQGINTVINGSIGTTAASTLITGFHDGTTGDTYTETPLNRGLVTGRIHAAPPAPGSAASAQIAANGLLAAQQAYLAISPAQRPGGMDPGAGELGGLTLAPGVYKSAGATFNISNGDLTLDAKGDPNAVWIFQTAAGLTVGIAGPNGAKSVKLVNGAQAKNVFWYVGTAAVINGAGGGVMVGTIISTAGITFSTAGNAAQTVLNGRAISLVASVTMVNTTINVPAN